MIMRAGIFCCYFLVFILCNGLFAGEVLYSVSDIPASLKQNARSVIRNKELIFTVKSVKSATVKMTVAVTVLNSNGLADSYLVLMYDKYRSIGTIKGRIFDQKGNLIRRIGAEDIIDHSAIAGYSLYEDTRVRFVDPNIRNYPFTIEYIFEISYNGLFQYPEWDPQDGFNVSVEKSSFKVIMPPQTPLRFKELNLPPSVAFSWDEISGMYAWEVRNLQAIQREPFSLPEDRIFPLVMIAPSEFEIGGVKGNMGSWEELGAWISSLNSGRDVLPVETVEYLKSMVSYADDDYSKVCLVYEYMQGRVRYVNIKTGLGGWQPIDASTVHRLAYGECKALTNYMKAMLDAIGIRSFYCLVRAGENAAPVITDFPSQQFNHAFLCVPLDTDTLWLECTSQRIPCGFLGNFTDDRDVLFIDNERSALVRSKVYGHDQNKVSRHTHVILQESGGGSCQSKAIYTGLKYSDMLPVLLADAKNRKILISEKIRFPGFQILSFNYLENRDIIPSIEETVSLSFEKHLTVMESKYFMKLNCASSVQNVPANVRSRKSNIYVSRSLMETDTIVYELPSSFNVESLPQPVNFRSDFGSYEAHAEISGGFLSYYRNFTLNKGTYPADAYEEFRMFFEKVYSADQLLCVLVPY